MNDNRWQVCVKFWHVLSPLVVHKVKRYLATQSAWTLLVSSLPTARCRGNCPWCWPGAEAWACLGQRWQLTGRRDLKTTQPHPVLVFKPLFLSTGFLMTQSPPFHVDRDSHLLSSTRAYDSWSTYITSFKPHNHRRLHVQKRTLTQGGPWSCPRR